jgi:hypothetical protein
MWAERAIASGTLTIGDLRNPGSEACTLRSSAKTPVAIPDLEPTDPALLAALCRRGKLILRLPIAPEGVGELVRLGWLHHSDCHDPASVGEAIIELANAALDARLRSE